jgi:hypothetical protein
VIRLVISGVCIVFLLSGNIFAAEREENDKDLKIMQLQQIIAEQTLARLQRDVVVQEYIRVNENYERLLEQIKKHQAEKAVKP